MKYNDNGEYKDIYVKAFDTLPVGTEVDYDGSTVPSGWEEVNNVLWTNPNPTSDFAGQNVIMTNWINEYSHYEIIYQERKDNTYAYTTGKLPINLSTRLRVSQQVNFERNAVVGTKGIAFGDSGYYATYGNTTKTTNNAYLIPYQIIGYKE